MPAKWQQWMPFHIDRFRASAAVQAMHPAARCGYLYLLSAQWQTEDCTLSGDPLDLAEKSGLGDELWALHGPRILRNFEMVDGGRVRNAVCFDEWQKAGRVFSRNHVPAEVVSEKRKEASVKGVEARWPENTEARNKLLRSQRLARARELGRHSIDEWQALVAFCGAICVRCGELRNLVRDHIKPIYQGGSDGIDNIQPLCAQCNSSKGPENIDYRPPNWRECLPNASPTGTVTSTEEQKQKPSRGKPRAKDPNCKTAKAQSRHDEFKEVVKKYWDHKNPGIQMPWDGREGKHLEMFLRAAPQITIAQFRGFLNNRAKSEVNHGERPSQWIDWVTSYSAGPMDKFGKTITNGGTNGASNPSPAKQRVDGARRKLAEIAVERGLLDPADFAQQFGQEVPESGSGGEHRGILQGLRSAGPEILSPEGGEGSGGAPH